MTPEIFYLLKKKISYGLKKGEDTIKEFFIVNMIYCVAEFLNHGFGPDFINIS